MSAAPVYDATLGAAGVIYGTVLFEAGTPVAAGSALVIVFIHPHPGSITVTYTVPLLAVAADPGAAVVALPGA